MFKVPLLEHLSQSNRNISYVVELCVCALLERGMHEEGLLRVGCGEFLFLLSPSPRQEDNHNLRDDVFDSIIAPIAYRKSTIYGKNTQGCVIALTLELCEMMIHFSCDYFDLLTNDY